MASLGSLVVSLAANTAQFEKDLGRAAHEAEKSMERMKASIEGMAKVASAAFAAGALAAAAFTKQSINAAEQLNKMAQSTGTSVEALSALVYAARLSDVSTEALGTSISRLNRNISDTAQGTGEAKESFAALGINVKDASGNLKTADQVLREVAIKFSQMEDGAGKSAIAIQLFGRSGAQMIPLLNQGASGLEAMRLEAEQFGQIISTEVAQAAEDFNDNLQRLAGTKQTLGNIIMQELLPPLNALTNAMVQASKETSTFSGVAQVVKIAFQAITVLFSEAAFAFTMIGGEIGAISMQLAALARFDFASARIIGETWTEEAKKAREEHDKFIASILSGVPIVKEYRDVWDRAALGGMFQQKAPKLVNKQEYAEQIAVIQGFVKQYEDAIKLQLDLVKEAEAQGQIGRIEVIAQTAAAEDARLQVLILGLQQEEEIYRKQGDIAKARVAAIKVQAAEADRAANDARTQAKMQTEDVRLAGELEAINNRYVSTIAAEAHGIATAAMSERERLQAEHDAKLEWLRAAEQQEIDIGVEYNVLREQLELEHQARMGDIWAETELKRRKFAQMNNRALIAEGASMMMQLTSTAATQSKKWFEIHKIASLANAIIKGIEAVQSAYAWGASWGGPAGGAAMAAIAAAATGANIQAIRNTQFGAGGAVGTFAASPATGLPEGPVGPTTRPQGQTTVIRLEGETFSREQLRQLVDKLNENTEDGGRLVVA